MKPNWPEAFYAAFWVLTHHRLKAVLSLLWFIICVTIVVGVLVEFIERLP